MSETFTKKRVLTDKVTYEILNKCVAISLKPNSCPEPIEFFASRKDWNAAVKKYKGNFIRVAQSIQKQYIYLDSTFWEEFDKFGFYGENGLNNLCTKQINPFKAIKQKDFNEDKLVWFYGEAHLLYCLDSDTPMSIPYKIDYIGGITNEYFDLIKAEEILKANPYVWNVKKIQIPYYNCDKYCSAAIEFTVKLPQNKYAKICKYFKDTVKENFWTCRVKDFFIYKPYWKDLKGIPYRGDVLGLKKAYREIKRNDDDY